MKIKTLRRALHATVYAVCLGLVCAGASAQTGQDDPATARHIRQLVETLTVRGHLNIEQRPVGTATFMRRFYSARRFQPAWSQQKNVDDLIAAVERSIEDGLSPRDFHLAAITRLRTPDGLSAYQRANRDVLMTNALVRLGYQLFYGKVDPRTLDANWNLDKPLDGEEAPEDLVASALRDQAVPALFASLRSPDPYYEELRVALAEQRLLAQKPQARVVDGPTLRKGDTGERVAALRARLDLPVGSDFDETVESAVKAFQADAQLAADGLVGRQTLAVLNEGPEEKIEKLRINLERARWFRDLALDERHIIVNIAGFRVYVFVGEEIAWESRAIVGRTYRKTPLFRGDMTYLVLNPTWTPTVRMIRQDIMPKVREDPGYLATKNMVVYDDAGAPVDPYAADWSNPFQYRIVQQPGPDNALGAVKFMFPNKHAVYLHDTPSRELFNETQRAFSAGCIRVENPIELAEGLLADQPSWQPDAIKAVLAGGETKSVHLTSPMPVYLLYWTANPLGVGEGVEYLPDIYERDGPILEALDSPFDPLDF